MPRDQRQLRFLGAHRVFIGTSTIESISSSDCLPALLRFIGPKLRVTDGTLTELRWLVTDAAPLLQGFLRWADDHPTEMQADLSEDGKRQATRLAASRRSARGHPLSQVAKMETLVAAQESRRRAERPLLCTDDPEVWKMAHAEGLFTSNTLHLITELAASHHISASMAASAWLSFRREGNVTEFREAAERFGLRTATDALRPDRVRRARSMVVGTDVVEAFARGGRLPELLSYVRSSVAVAEGGAGLIAAARNADEAMAEWLPQLPAVDVQDSERAVVQEALAGVDVSALEVIDILAAAVRQSPKDPGVPLVVLDDSRDLRAAAHLGLRVRDVRDLVVEMVVHGRMDVEGGQTIWNAARGSTRSGVQDFTRVVGWWSVAVEGQGSGKDLA